jgi:outer membrane lipoprotein-sorting protein
MRIRQLAAVGGLAAAVAAGQTADELLSKNIAARGGLAALKAVRTMRLTGTMKAGDDTLPSVLELKRPNMSRWEFRLDGQTAVQAFDGRDGWMWIPFAGQREPQVMSEEERKEAEQQADIDGPLVDYKEKGSKIDLVGHDPDFRSDDWKLKVTLKTGEVRYVYLDPKTFLQTVSVMTRKIDGVEVEIRSEVGDYRKVGALVLPHSFTATTRDGGQQQSLKFDKIELGVPIDDGRFRMPPPRQPTAPAEPAPTPAVGTDAGGGGRG